MTSSTASAGETMDEPTLTSGTTPSPVNNDQPAGGPAKGVTRPGDQIFLALATGSSWFVTILIGAVGAFLLWRAVPALTRNDANFFTYSETWNLTNTEAMLFGIPNLFFVTVLVSFVALVIAMPVALGIAIFLSNYCPKRFVKPLGYVIDLLAAVPSIVYGLWGFKVLGPTLGPFFRWLSETIGFIPLFTFYQGSSPAFETSRNVMTGAVVLAIMILPIIAATAREVFVQTPKGHIEAALALGATRWEVVRMTVLPFGLSGYISGGMLGLGRALGETMALYLVISSAPAFRWSLFDGGTTFATAIATAAPEFNDNLKAGAYISAGLVLFALTFVVNAAARAIVARSGASSKGKKKK